MTLEHDDDTVRLAHRNVELVVPTLVPGGLLVARPRRVPPPRAGGLARPRAVPSGALLELTAAIARASVELLEKHLLRTGNAVQLASCLHVRRERGEGVSLLAYDARLNDAARAEGLSLPA